MLLNLASDKPFVFNSKDGFIFFDRKNLELQLPEFFKNKVIKNIYVITGPGYFSSTRIGSEVVNILKFLGVIDNIYFLDKLNLFKQFMESNNLDKLYLFSGNKNKFILLQKNSYSEVLKKNMDETVLVEQLFEITIPNSQISYKDVLKEYESYKWELSNKYIYPYYIFEPIVQK